MFRYVVIVNCIAMQSGSWAFTFCRNGRKVAGSRPDEVNDFFFNLHYILQAALVSVVYSSSNRNEYQKQKNNVSGE
jgi:hypothetical protein